MSAWVPLIVGLFAAAISIAVPIVVPKGPNSEYVRGGASCSPAPALPFCTLACALTRCCSVLKVSLVMTCACCYLM